ncbi:MAG: hypothetical protein ACFCVH_00340 [Alphaproteobacteria bacterium]
MTAQIHNPAFEADPQMQEVGVVRASDVPMSRASKVAALVLLLAVISLLVPLPERWFVDDSPQRAASLIDQAQGLANEDEYNKRDVTKVIDTLTNLTRLLRAGGLDEETEQIVVGMEAATADLSVRVEEMRGRDRMEPPLPGLTGLEPLRAHFDEIREENAALLAFGEARVRVSAVVALLAAVFLVVTPAFDRRLNAVPVFGAVEGGMKVGQARAVTRAVILLCAAALVMIFQPNIEVLYTVGAGLVVLGGLAFNMVPMALPGRRFRGVVKAALIVLVVLVVAILLALGSAELYSLYLESRQR